MLRFPEIKPRTYGWKSIESRHHLCRFSGQRRATTLMASNVPGQPAATIAGNTAMASLLAMAMQQQQQQQQQQRTAAASSSRGTTVSVRGLTFHPPGAESPLLQDINMTLRPNSLNLIIGRSGSGKTTLLQVRTGCGSVDGGVEGAGRRRCCRRGQVLGGVLQCWREEG